MQLKKALMATIPAVLVAAGTLFTSPTMTEAADVWIYTDKANQNFWVDTDTIYRDGNKSSCYVKCVGSDRDGQYVVKHHLEFVDSDIGLLCLQDGGRISEDLMSGYKNSMWYKAFLVIKQYS